MQPKPRLPGSKLDKWRLIEQVPALADCQPQTVEYSPHALQAFLMRHPVLFLKPDNSFGGKDVIRLHLEQPE
ncbi:MAG TPA: YheC/YheD family protein, partial [Bacilli bacterium]|nr:YheC/YheD family protein [Bacilli bacterium]